MNARQRETERAREREREKGDGYKDRKILKNKRVGMWGERDGWRERETEKNNGQGGVKLHFTPPF